MTSNPITPPPYLVKQWLNETTYNMDEHSYVAGKAAQWAADQELDECCEWLRSQYHSDAWVDQLRAIRRPKPPSLKEQALARLALLELLVADLEKAGLVPFHEKDDSIRRALEQLND